MVQKKSKSSVVERQLEVVGSLKKLGTDIYNQLDKGVFPTINMPSRSTENINYDPVTRQYILGERVVSRSARNIRHVKPFTQLAWAAMFSNELTTKKKTSTLRDVYYSAQAYEMTFTDQQESNNIITDLETVTGFSREDFHIFPEERSAIFGDLTIGYTVPGYEGKQLNLTSHPDGVHRHRERRPFHQIHRRKRPQQTQRTPHQLRRSSAKANSKFHSQTQGGTESASLHLH